MHDLLANLPNWILVVLTALTLIVLYGYAKDTKRIAKTGIEQLEKLQMPFVSLLAKPAEPNRHGGGWAIENQGTGPAINIRHSRPQGQDGWEPTVRTFAVGDFRIMENFDFNAVRNREFIIEYESLSGKKYRTVVDWPAGAMRTRFSAIEAYP
jgi:hypothetical protein